jgi:hypothetical protein
MAETIKIDPSRFSGPQAGKSGEAASDQTIKRAEAKVADAQRTADTVKKQTDAKIAKATEADQIREANAKADKAVFDLEKVIIELDALRAGGVPLTESQGKAGSFYSRMLSSEQSMDKLGQDPDSLIGKTAYEIAPGLTAMASTSKRTTTRDYIKNFLMASLRKESGAVIAPFELTNQYQIYFPSADASPEEIAAKKQQRILAIANMRAEAGPGGPKVDEILLEQGFTPVGMKKPTEEQPASGGSTAAKDAVAGAGAETTTIKVPEELQSAVMAYVDAKGKNIDAKEFKDFFNKTAEEIGYPNRLSDEEAKRNADAIREGARYGGVTPGDRPLSAVERGVNKFLLSDPGAFATGVFNATTMGIPAALSENVGRSTEGVRDENGLAYGIGEIGGNLAMTTGGGGLLKLAGLSPGKAELLSDAGYSAITGFTGAEGDVTDRLGGAATNTIFAGMGAAAPSVLKRTLKTNPDDDVKILREAGVRLTPAQTIGGNIDRGEEAASRVLFGGGDMALSSRRRAFNDFNTAYLNSAGKYIGFQLPNDLKPHTRMKAIGEAFDKQYDIIRSQMSVAPDQDLLDDIADLRSVINDGSTFSPENAARLGKLLDDQLVRRTANPIDGDEFKSLQSLLKKRKNEFAKNGNLELADGVENMQAILDNAARRRSPPEVVDMLNETDRGFALLAQAQEAAKMAGNKPGEFSPAQILSRQRAADTRNRSRSFVEGDMEGQRLAEAGQNVLGNVLPSSGTTERLAAATATGATGAFVSPWSLLPNAMIGMANAPGVRDVLPAVFAGKRPAPIDALGGLMERYKVPIRYAGAEFGRQFSPSDQTPEDYAVTNIENPIAVSATQGYPAQQAAPTATLADMAVEQAAEPAALPADAGALIDKRTGREIYLDPESNEYKDALTGEVVQGYQGMYRGGHVQRFKNGGQPKAGYDYANAARTFGQGLTFGFGDEIEAKLRALASKDPKAYENEVKRIRLAQQGYAEANPMTSGGLEMAGMVGGAMLTPSLAALRVPGAVSRVAARAPRLSKFGVGLVEDGLQGAAYSAGKAEPIRGEPETSRMQAVRNDAPQNALTYMEMRALGKLGKEGFKRAVGTKPGRQAALAVRNFAQNPFAIFRGR